MSKVKKKKGGGNICHLLLTLVYKELLKARDQNFIEKWTKATRRKINANGT